MRRLCAAIPSNRPRGSARSPGGPSDPPLLAGCANSSLVSVHVSTSVRPARISRLGPTPALASSALTIGLSGSPRPRSRLTPRARRERWRRCEPDARIDRQSTTCRPSHDEQWFGSAQERTSRKATAVMCSTGHGEANSSASAPPRTRTRRSADGTVAKRTSTCRVRSVRSRTEEHPDGCLQALTANRSGASGRVRLGPLSKQQREFGRLPQSPNRSRAGARVLTTVLGLAAARPGRLQRRRLDRARGLASGDCFAKNAVVCPDRTAGRLHSSERGAPPCTARFMPRSRTRRV